jgi:hypothetical protein
MTEINAKPSPAGPPAGDLRNQLIRERYLFVRRQLLLGVGDN